MQEIDGAVDANRDRLFAITQDLVRIPSENIPPRGSEGACQQYVAEFLRRLGWEPELYEPDCVPGIREHPEFHAGRDYHGRPNLVAHKAGSGGGRSLLLSGHIDTVPRGARSWRHDPFSGTIENGRLYGRGSNDMKAGIATNLFVAELLAREGVRLRGGLTIETVVDEEFGGANGTLAARVKGVRADAAVISEPSWLRICPAQRGGRTAHITLREAGGILREEPEAGGVADRLRRLLEGVERFAAERRGRVAVHPYFANCADPVPVSVTRVSSGAWGTTEPQNVCDQCQVELYWQTMPGEEREDVDREFNKWLSTVFSERPEVEFPIRWLPGSALAGKEPLITCFEQATKEALGSPAPVAGIEGPCDMFLFHRFGIPAILWGAKGGNTHAPDEYVELDALTKSAKALLRFVRLWCGE